MISYSVRKPLMFVQSWIYYHINFNNEFKHNNKNNPFNNKLVVIKVGTYLAINNNQYKNKNQSLNPSKINYNRTLQMEQ